MSDFNVLNKLTKMKNIIIMSLAASSVMKYQDKKILLLLSIEMAMISIISMIMEEVTIKSYSMNNIILVSVIMVTESVLGISVMIMNSRESDNKMVSYM